MVEGKEIDEMEAWFERVIEEMVPQEKYSIDVFRESLRRRFPEYTEAQYEALEDFYEWEVETLRRQGIRPVWVEFPWGAEIRFVWKERRGLWGAKRISEIAKVKFPEWLRFS